MLEIVRRQWHSFISLFGGKTRRNRVLIAARKGDFAPLLHDAEAALEETLWHCGAEHPETARKLAALASVHEMRGEYSHAEPFLRRAIAIFQYSRSPEEQAELPRLLEQLANLLRSIGSFALAKKIYEDLLVRYEQTYAGEVSVDQARTLDNLALTLKEQGCIPTAKERHRDALLVWERVCGPGSPEVARCLTQLASLYLSEHRYEEAEPLLLRAVAEWKSSPNPNDLYTIITLSCCGDLYRSTGRDGEARGAEAAAKAVLARYAK